MWKNIRIFLLLLVLATVVQQTLMEDSDLDWKKNFYVAVYPVNADKSSEVSAYLKSLNQEAFEPVSDFFATQSTQYNLGLRRPIEVKLGEEIYQIPPSPPANGGVLQVMIWSLKFRYFAWKNSPKMHIKPDIKLYLLYYNPATSPSLSHSTALNKGRIGRVNLFGENTYHQQNLVILAHELLHTVKATDKYDLSTTLPIYPDGFAEPDKQPLYPQTLAELMGGRIPKTEDRADIPQSLSQTIVGQKTAREIGWLN